MTDYTLPYTFAKRHQVLMLEQNEQRAIIVYHQLPSIKILTQLRWFLAKSIQGQMVSLEEFQRLLTQNYETNSQTAQQIMNAVGEDFDLHRLLEEMPKSEDLLENQDEAPIIRLLNALLSQAIKQKASDIHFETFEEKLLVRFRVDGVLSEIAQLQRVLAPLIISRIKVMAKLDIAEKRLPQDGRMSLRIAGHTVDTRVSTMPANHGERIVLRLLDKKVAQLDLLHLGMTPAALQLLQKLIHTPHGIILVTGPTGSGKTTSLYAMLTALNDVHRNILTIEDPIEFDLPGIGQTQVNPKVNMTFAKGLRAILRQDPDVVMVGEIRDKETAEIAVQASLTGHLVLSTLHTNTAIGAITRLRDMHIEEFLLASSLIGVVAQRLVRVLCPHCKISKEATPSEQALLKINRKAVLYHPQGCEACNFLGYSGRTGIYEVIVLDDKLQSMIHQNHSEQNMEHYARSFFPSMRQDGFERALKGETSLEEVMRVSHEH